MGVRLERRKRGREEKKDEVSTLLRFVYFISWVCSVREQTSVKVVRQVLKFVPLYTLVLYTMCELTCWIARSPSKEVPVCSSARSGGWG
jgi:hypothetical protein